MAGERTVKIKFVADAKSVERESDRAGRGVSRFADATEKLRSKAAGASKIVGTLLTGFAAAPAIGAAAAATAGLAVSLAAAGAAAGVFGKVLGATQAEVTENATNVEALRDKIDGYAEQAAAMKKAGQDNASVLKQQAAAQLELKTALEGMDPAMRSTVSNYLAMKAAGKGFVDANKPATLGLLSRGYALVTNNISKFQPLFDLGARAADRALKALERFSAGGGVQRIVDYLTSRAGPALDNLARIAGNVGSFLGNVFKAAPQQGGGFLKFLADASDKLRTFGEGGGIQRVMDAITGAGPGVVSTLAQFATAAVAIAKAVTPLAPVSLAIAGALAAIIAAVPPQVITALAAAWVAYTVALTAYNAVMGVVAVATKVWAAAQAALNFVMALNPIGLIVIAVVALIAVIVLIATKTKFFQTVWSAVWGAIKAAAKAVGDWFTGTLLPSLKKAFDQLMSIVKFVVNVYKQYFNLLLSIGRSLVNGYIAYVNKIVSIIRSIASTVKSVVDTVVGKFGQLIGFIAGLPGRIASVSRGLWDGIKNSFRAAINYVIDKWNSLSFSLPSINTPFGKIGGTTISTPNIPRLASGGWMQPGKTYLTGENGPELLTSGRPAYVNSAGATADMGGTPEVHVYIGDRELTDIVNVQITQKNRQTRRAAGARLAGVGA